MKILKVFSFTSLINSIVVILPSFRVQPQLFSYFKGVLFSFFFFFAIYVIINHELKSTVITNSTQSMQYPTKKYSTIMQYPKSSHY